MAAMLLIRLDQSADHQPLVQKIRAQTVLVGGNELRPALLEPLLVLVGDTTIVEDFTLVRLQLQRRTVDT